MKKTAFSAEMVCSRVRWGAKHVWKWLFLGESIMKTMHHPHGLGQQELQAMAADGGPSTIDDMEASASAAAL